MSEYVIKMEHVGKKYGKAVVLKDINMTIKRGEIYGLVGNNGAGKTTIMKILTNMTQCTEGDFTLFDRYGKERKEQQKRLGVLIDDPGFFEGMNARENLEYFRRQFGIPGKECIEEALKLVDLADTGKKKYKAFSMGMKQRLGLALALMHSPEVLILDEPINGVDPEGIIELRNVLKKINEERNTTILISSHILAEMSNIATYYGFISHGQLLEELSAQELMEKSSVYLNVIADDSAKMLNALERVYPDLESKVYPDGSIHMFNHIEDDSNVCKIGVESQAGLHRVEKKSINLEDYYMSVINRAEVHHA